MKLKAIVIEIDSDDHHVFAQALALLAPQTNTAPAAIPLIAHKPAAKEKQAPPRTPLRNHGKSKPAPAAASTPVSHPGGVTINGWEISYGDRSITVRPKEAACAAALAKVMPSLLTYQDLGRIVWDRNDDVALYTVKATLNSLDQAVAAIGLKVTRVRGMGASLGVV